MAKEDLFLSEQDKQKLDGVVKKMISNKESDEDIKFVIDHFTNKYGLKKKEPTQSDLGAGESLSPSTEDKLSPLQKAVKAGAEKIIEEKPQEIISTKETVTPKAGTITQTEELVGPRKPTFVDRIGMDFEKGRPTNVGDVLKPKKEITPQEAASFQAKIDEKAWKGVQDRVAKSSAFTPKQYFEKASDIYAQVNLDEDQQKEYALMKDIENTDKQIHEFNLALSKGPNPVAVFGLNKAVALKATQEAAYTKYKEDKYKQIDAEIADLEGRIQNPIGVANLFNIDNYKEKIKELKSQKENFFLDQDQLIEKEFGQNKEAIKKFEVPGNTPKEKLQNYYLLLQEKEDQLWKQLNPSGDDKVSVAQGVSLNDIRFLGYALPSVVTELIPGANKDLFDKWQEVRKTIKAISPAVLINRNPVKDVNEGFFESFGKSAAKVLVPSSENYITTPAELSGQIKQSIALAGIPEKAISKETGKILSDEAKGPESFSSEWWGNVAGTSAGMIPYFAAGTELIKGASMLGKLPVYTRYLQGTKYGKYLVSEPVMTGLGYKTAGYIMPSNSDVLDEATFMSGFLGGVAQAGLNKVLNTKFVASMFNRLFGDEAENMAIMVSKVGERVGQGLGEYAEEVGNTVGQMLDSYTKSSDFNKLKKDFNDNFGTMSKNLELFVASFTMGAIMGAGTGYGKASAERSKDFYNSLSADDKKKADTFVQRVTQERYNALVAAKKADIQATGAKAEPVTQKDINDKNEAIDVLNSKESSPQERQAALSVLADVNLKIDSNKIAKAAEAELKAGNTSIEVKPEDELVITLPPMGITESTTENTVEELKSNIQDIEAKKADIEKRRQEELDSVIQTTPIEILDEKGNVVQTSDERVGINAKYDAELAALEGKTKVEEGVNLAEKTEPKPLTNGDQVQLEPQMKGGMPRIMEFKDGTWFQKVGNELANVSKEVQQEAQDLYDSQNKTRVSGEVRVGQEPIQTKPIEGPSKEAPSTSGDVQTLKEVDETKAGAIELKTMEIANQNVTKFLEDSGIEVNIMNTQEEFDAAQKDEGLAAERGTEGMFISKSGKIYINKSNLGKGWAKTILYHEATHPVINIIRNTNPEKYKALVSGVKELAKTNKDVNDALEWAKKQYAGKPEGTIEDEGIVEVIARISSGAIKFGQIEPTLREKIIDFINKIAKAIGLSPITPKTDTETFKKTARQVADAMRRGKSISKVVGKENVKEFSFAESTPQQRKDSESIAKDTEDKVIEGKIQPSMILNGAKGGQPINLYTGEASIDAIREFKPKMYISRALELSKTHLAKGTTRKYRVDSSLESQLQWADEVYKKAKDTVVSNLLFIYDNTPSHIRDISKLWYDGANIIAQELSSKYGITLEQASAVIATQSPQKPWYDNVHLAHFIIDFNSKNQKTPMSQEDFDYYKLKSSDPKTGKSYTKQVEYLPVLEKSIGTKLEDLSLYDRAVMARTAFDLKYDRKAPLRLPNGVIIGTVKNLSSHSGYDTIAKGLSILQDGSKQNISANLGDAYKVRNFNNNIVNPKASNEVTIDTHAIAASYLLPLGSSSEEVKFDEATYGFFADAYREAAKQRGVLAREMQSITWEGARAIFPSNEKSQAKKDVAKNEWAKYKNGEESLEDVQKTIKQNGNDLSKTDWAAFINRMLEKNESTDYVAELPINSGYKPAVGSGASKRAASGLSSVVKGDRGTSKSQKSVGQREDLQKSEKQTTFAQDETRKQKGVTPRGQRVDRQVGSDSSLMGSESSRRRGFERIDSEGSRKIGGRTVNVSAIFKPTNEIISNVRKAIPSATVDRELLEITSSPNEFHRFISMAKAVNDFGASVYVYENEDTRQPEYEGMRLFVTPDGKAGVALKPNGDLVSGFNTKVEGKPNRLPQLILLAIKEGATKTDAFNTVLPDYYSKFGFRAVAKSTFNDEFAPKEYEDIYGNKHVGWDYETYKRFQGGRPDVVYFVYDGGDRATIQNRIGTFEPYSEYSSEVSLVEDPDQGAIKQDKAMGKAQMSTGGRNLAPNNKPSNLNEVQYKQVRTPEFKKWFGDWENDPKNASKIVDENGEPKVMYTGTSKDKDFDKFNVPKNGAWFSGDPAVASMYAETNDSQKTNYDRYLGAYIDVNTRPRVIPVFLNVRRPQDFKEVTTQEQRDKMNYSASYKKLQALYFQNIYFDKPIGERTDGLYMDNKSTVIILEDPNQIKSATGNSGKFSPTDNRIQMSTGGREVMNVGGVQQRVKDLPEGLSIVDGFYSPIEKRIIEFKQPKASATKWKEIVGAKSDEAVFSGMTEWLNTFKPDQQISKEEVQDFIKNNRVEIKQVIKADNWREFYDQRVAAMNKEYEYFKTKGIGRFDIQRTIPDAVFDKLNDADQDRLINLKAEQDFLGDVYFDYGNARQVLTGAKESEMPKYKKYVERGNFDDYKEILVTAPVGTKAQMANANIERRLNEIDDELTTVRTYKKVGDSGTVSDFELVVTDQEKFDKLVAERKSLLEEDKKVYKQIQDAKDAEYRSSHYNEKNIVVHTRTDVRNDQNGDKLFFIEEVQSDWGQQGKKEGFKNSETEAKLKELQNEAAKARLEFESIENELDKQYEAKKKDGESRSELKERDPEFMALAKKYRPAEMAAFEAGKAFDEFQVDNRGETPTAPYVTNTNAWVKLGLKIALQQAVQADAAKIAWTTGEQQNKRYDLSKQVDAITYEKNDDGTYNVDGLKNNRSISYQENMTVKQMESALGKDVAQRIVDNEGDTYLDGKYMGGVKVLTGDKLSVGGKGMTGFYGSLETPGIMGNAIKALVKELTGKEPTIEASALGYTDDYEDEVISNKEEYDAALKRAGVFLYKGEVLSKSEAFDYLERGMKIGATFPKVDLQPSIEITPELKAAVERGMAQFSKGERGVKPTFEEATDLFYKIKGTEGAAKKKALADERKALMDQNPSVKYIDDNIKTILDQLEKKEMATRKGNCP